MSRNSAVTSGDFANAINSPGAKLLDDARSNDPDLFAKVQNNADQFDAEFEEKMKEGESGCKKR